MKLSCTIFECFFADLSRIIFEDQSKIFQKLQGQKQVLVPRFEVNFDLNSSLMMSLGAGA